MEGLSIEKQVELMSEVVHNHSNEIDEIDRKCFEAFGMVQYDMEWLEKRENEIDMTLAKGIDNVANSVDGLSGSIASVAVWTFLGFLGVGGLAWLGYKAYEDHEERLNKIEKRCNPVYGDYSTEADDTVENPKMASK